jgi:hypothetical protein
VSATACPVCINHKDRLLIGYVELLYGHVTCVITMMCQRLPTCQHACSSSGANVAPRDVVTAGPYKR